MKANNLIKNPNCDEYLIESSPYNVDNVTYDARGNILSMRRKGRRQNSWGGYSEQIIDKLIFTIKSGSNELETITDGSGLFGLKEGVLGNTSFSYDNSGRLTSKVEQYFPSQRTTNIEEYNHHDLPQRISTGDFYIHTHYTADGQKVKVKRNYREMGSLVDEEIINLGPVQLKNGSLYTIPHEEGTFRIDDEGVFHREYYIKDHLGNIRVRFEDEDGDGRIRRVLPAENEPSESEVISSHHYYPFGLEWKGLFYQDASKEIDRHRYNGKELETVGLYDYGFRWYDPAVGRFMSVDPLASKMPAWSPYSYTFNNPIRFIDPDGRFPITPSFRKNYPLLTNFIENRLQNYIVNSPRMSSVLLNYTGGNLTHNQIASDFASDGGPTITNHSYNPHGLDINGEYDYQSNTIKFSDEELNRFEKILGNSDETIQKWGMMDFTELFVNEYVHYGDALDGLDVIQDENGNIVNDPNAPEPTWGNNVFEEGNEAAAKLFPLPTGRQNYFLYKNGQYVDPRSRTVHGTDETKKDETMIPPNN